MSTVYAKTPKGLSELESRAGGLKPKIRRVLIMIDGKRDLDEVTRLSLGDDAAVTDAIRQLLLEGYVDLAGSPATQEAKPFATAIPANVDTDEVLTAPPPVPRPAPATTPSAHARPEALNTPPPAEAPIIASTEKTGPNIAPPDPFGGLIKI